jgi:hypothetical protein
MKYLCLAYEEEKKLNALSQSEWERPQGARLWPMSRPCGRAVT